MYMQGDWKREQELVKQLEKDLKFKEEQLTRTQEANAGQASVMNSLQSEIRKQKATIDTLQLRQSTVVTPRHKKIDISEMEMLNKAAQNQEELEKLLAQRTEELDQAMSDLSIFEQTVQ